VSPSSILGPPLAACPTVERRRHRLRR